MNNIKLDTYDAHMKKIIKKKHTKTIISAIPPVLLGIGLMMYFIFFSPSPTLFFIGAIWVATIPLVYMQPLTGIIVMLTLRNSVDMFSEETLISITGIDINFAALLGLFIIAWSAIVVLTKYKQPKTKIPALWPWLAVLIIATLSIGYTVDTTKSIAEIIKLLSSFTLFFTTFVTLQSTKEIKKILAGIVIAMVIPSMFAIVQLVSGTGLMVDGITNRVFGTFFHPNVLGISSVITLGVIFMFILFPKKIRRQSALPHTNSTSYIAAIMGIVTIVALIFTFTRSAWIGAVILIGCFFWTLIQKRTIIITSFVIILAVMIPAVHSVANSNLGTKIAQNNVVERVTGDDAQGSIEWRTRSWSETLPAIRGHELIGYGIGSFPQVRRSYVSYESDLLSLEAHNDYLRLLIEIGGIGLLAYIILFSTLIKHSIKGIQHNNQYKKVFTIYLGIVVALLLISITENVLRATAVQWMFWVLTGAMMKLSILTKQTSTVILIPSNKL